MKREEKLNNNIWQPLSALLGLANKAGKLKFGMTACYQSCASKRAKLVLIAENLSDNSRKKIEHVIDQQGLKAFSYGTKEKFGLLFNRSNIGLICIEDVNFAAGIEQLMS